MLGRLRKLSAEEEPERIQNSWRCAKYCKKRLGSRSLRDKEGRKVQRRLGKVYIEAEPQRCKKSWRYAKQCKKKMNKRELERDKEMCAHRESENKQNSIGKIKKGRRERVRCWDG